MKPNKAAALVAKLGDDESAGVYYDDEGRLVVAVTNRSAADLVRSQGGTAKIVPHSMADLKAIQATLDRKVAGIPNTAWGIDPSSNQVSVAIFDGVSAADQERIEAAVANHRGAVTIERLPGTLNPDFSMRGGLGMYHSNYGLCSPAFNVRNSSGERFLLTAGHCQIGGNYHWWRLSNEEYLGKVIHWQSEPGDWAIIDYRNADVTAYGDVQLKNGTQQGITNSRSVVDGESVKRAGTTSQDLVGKVTRPSVTVTYVGGATFYDMIETTLCSKDGDSGGAVFTGSTALGIHSGSTDWRHADPHCGDYVDPEYRQWRSYHQPIQPVIVPYNLEVF